MLETGCSYITPAKKQEDSESYRDHGTALIESLHAGVSVYFLREDTIKVHQTRVKPCPDGLLAGYYWYGNKRKGPGRPPKWVEKILSATDNNEPQDEPIADTESQEEPESSMASIADTD